MPIFFAGTTGGVAAAEGGSLEKLCFQVGCLAQAFWMVGARFRLVTVVEWKGQLPKAIVKARLLDMLGKACKDYKADIWDAVGIGLYAMGVKL